MWQLLSKKREVERVNKWRKKRRLRRGGPHTLRLPTDKFFSSQNVGNEIEAFS